MRTRIDFRNQKLAGIDLAGAHLDHAGFAHADLAGANLTQAHLRNSCLSSPTLSNANLTDANLAGADLGFADCTRATLTGADLTAADLDLANLAGADMTYARLSNATLIKANVAGANLTSAKLLHIIDYIPSMLNEGSIQFYSCFISYSTKDQNFADRLRADLQKKGVRCWFAPHDIRAGKKIHEQIDEAIRVYDRLLLILSAESMTSDWVATEIANARKKEVEQKRRVLFPISIAPYSEVQSWELFDADRGMDSAREIREY